MSKTIKNLSRLILLEHSIFALPFTLASFLIANRLGPLILTHPFGILLLLIVCCAVTARTAAMGFNRVVDLKFDKDNPRTANRELVVGAVSLSSATLLVLSSSLGFILCSFLIGPHCGVLSPLVLAVLFFYSLTKRFTAYSHLVLGLALGLAPGGAWWVIRPQIELVPLTLMIAVTFWVAGFDTIYACQDIEFDKKNNLYSIPAKLGKAGALNVSKLFHVASLLFLFWMGMQMHFGVLYFLGLAPVAVMLAYQHYLIRGGDLTRLNRAFFTVNGWVAMWFLVLIVIVTN